MRLNQVTVPCVDFGASVAFYKTLGLIQIVDSPPRYARFECPAGDGGAPATFSLHHVEGWSGADEPLVYFEVDDLAGEYERLKAVGIEFLSAPQDQTWLWKEAYLRDPAGNRVCLYQAGVNRRFPPWRLGGADKTSDEIDLSPGALHPSLGLYQHRRIAPAGNELVFISGQVGVNAAGETADGLAAQADGAFANIMRNLNAEGLGPENVLKLTTFIVERVRGEPGIREARLKYFGEMQPASTAVYVSGLVDPNWLVEVEAVAARPAFQLTKNR